MNKAEKIAFEAAMKKHADALHLLKLSYLAAQLREAELNEMFDKTCNEVLQEYEFFVSEKKNPEKVGLKPGDRIINEKDSYLMDDSDFNIYLKYAVDKQCKLGYVETDGTYKPGFNGMEIKLNAQNALIDFQISILPEEMRGAFKDIKKSYILTHKFLDIIMGRTENEEIQ